MAIPIYWAAVVQEGRDLWAKLSERLVQPQDRDRGELRVEEEYNVNWMQEGS